MEHKTITIIQISFVPYKDGKWEFMIEDRATGDAVVLSKGSNLTEEQKEFLYRVAPMCVYTKYQEVA